VYTLKQKYGKRPGDGGRRNKKAKVKSKNQKVGKPLIYRAPGFWVSLLSFDLQLGLSGLTPIVVSVPSHRVQPIF